VSEPQWELPEAEMFDWARPGAGVRPDASARPDIHLPETSGQEAEHRDHLIHQGLDALHFASLLGEVAEMGLVAHGSAAAGAAAVAAPLGAVATVIVTAMEFYRATSTDKRIQVQKGLAHGLMWEVLGLPDADHTMGPATFGDGYVPLSDYEQSGWDEGVREGRRIGQREDVKKEIERALAYEMVVQNRDLDTDPQHRAWNVAVTNVLNRVWDQVHEDSGPLNGSTLSWEGVGDGFPVDRRAP
jgi:hypothetical protein